MMLQYTPEIRDGPAIGALVCGVLRDLLRVGSLDLALVALSFADVRDRETRSGSA